MTGLYAIMLHDYILLGERGDFKGFFKVKNKVYLYVLFKIRFIIVKRYIFA